MEDLTDIYPTPPKPIDLREPEKKVVVKEGDLQVDVKDTIKTGFAIIGLLVVGAYSINTGLAKIMHAEDPMFNISSDEDHAISRIHKFCYNPVSVLNDREACEDSWRKYRQLGKYNADGPVTNTQLSQAHEDFQKKGIETQHDKWEKDAENQAGNVQSPAK